MNAGDTKKALAPVYVPYATFISALDSLRVNGIPATGKIDKTLWPSQSGAVQGQLVLAFRFLGLIDDQLRVLPVLPQLASASPEDRKKLLRRIIEDKYRIVLDRDVKSISAGQLNEAFRTFENVSGSTLVRAVRFFIKACQEVDIPISPRLANKTRNAAIARKRRAGNGSRRPTDRPEEMVPQPPPQTGGWEEKLLEKFPAFDPSWPDDLKTKWFEGFERLMKAKEG
jgi:hypothetical protein